MVRTFVKRAPVAEAFTAVHVVELSQEVYLYWHQQIEPVIRKLPTRLDRKWNWSPMYRYLPLALEKMMGRDLPGYAVLVLNDDGDVVPAGLVLLSVGYPALDADRESSVFLWYLTSAPLEALQGLKVGSKPRLLEILVDIAFVVSEARGYHGRIGLHAEDEPGNPEAQKLLDRYQTRCGLLSLPPDASMRGLARRNDGRYFYATPRVAQERMAALDYLR